MQVSVLKKSLITLALVSMATFSHSQQPSMSFAEIGLGQTDIDGKILGIDTFKGLSVAASHELTDTFYVPLSYYKHSNDMNESLINNDGGATESLNATYSVDISEFTLGLGYKFGVSDSSVIATDINYLKLEVNLSSEVSLVIVDSDGFSILANEQFSESDSVSSDGFSVRSVYQNLLDNGFQFNLGLQYKWIREDGENIDDTAVIAEGVYYFNDNLGAKLGALVGEDTQLSVSVRYSF